MKPGTFRTMGTPIYPSVPFLGMTELQRECVCWMTDNDYTVGVRLRRDQYGDLHALFVDRDSCREYTIHPDGRRDLSYDMDFTFAAYETFEGAYSVLNPDEYRASCS